MGRSMSPGNQTVRAYTEVKAQMGQAIADLNAVIAKATALSATLAPHIDYDADRARPGPRAAGAASKETVGRVGVFRA